MPHAPQLWGRKATVMLAARGQQDCLEEPQTLEEVCDKVSSQRWPGQGHFNTIWPHTYAHNPHHVHNDLSTDITHRLLSILCVDLQRVRLQKFLLSWHSLSPILFDLPTPTAAVRLGFYPSGWVPCPSSGWSLLSCFCSTQSMMSHEWDSCSLP